MTGKRTAKTALQPFTTMDRESIPRQEAGALRLLLPIDETLQGEWAVKYALWKHELGTIVDVVLLHVEQQVLPPWEVLRFRTDQELAEIRAAHVRSLLEQAAAPFRQRHVSHQLCYREGEVIFEILDAAEQMNCDQIVVAAPPNGWQRLFSRCAAPRLLRHQRTVPIVTVNAHGMPNAS